jgi:aerobic carbon-monoxide dehydrogenase medium subunit
MRFDYLEPESIEEAIALLQKHKGTSKVLAGGTDLMVQIRNRALRPEVVVDITRIPGMDSIVFDESGALSLGSLVTIRALETSAEIQNRYPVISQAAAQLGSVAIRNVATVGGNLCNGLPSAETAQVLVALSAEAKIVGPAGERRVALESFFTGVGQTLLAPDEILVEILVPEYAADMRGIYIKHSHRGPIDLAIVNVTVLMRMEKERKVCRDAKIVLGTVAPTPLRAKKAEEALRGAAADQTVIDRAARIASDEAHPRQGSLRGSYEYKKEMVKVLTARAIRQLVAE